jgi:hypothetical protein
MPTRLDQHSDQASSLRAETSRDYARLGAEVTRLARVAASVHAAQLAEDARDEAFEEARSAQFVRDQASRLRLYMQEKCA